MTAVRSGKVLTGSVQQTADPMIKKMAELSDQSTLNYTETSLSKSAGTRVSVENTDIVPTGL